MSGTDLTGGPRRQALSDRLALKPYWRKPTVRNFREGDGNVGIIRSPVRAITLPDQCATKARRTSGWKFHPSKRRFDSVATRTAAAEAAGTMSPVRGD